MGRKTHTRRILFFSGLLGSITLVALVLCDRMHSSGAECDQPNDPIGDKRLSNENITLREENKRLRAALSQAQHVLAELRAREPLVLMQKQEVSPPVIQTEPNDSKFDTLNATFSSPPSSDESENDPEWNYAQETKLRDLASGLETHTEILSLLCQDWKCRIELRPSDNPGWQSTMDSFVDSAADLLPSVVSDTTPNGEMTIIFLLPQD